MRTRARDVAHSAPTASGVKDFPTPVSLLRLGEAMDAASKALVERMEALMDKVEAAKQANAQKDAEIVRLTREGERRAAALPTDHESAAVQRLRREVEQRQDELAQLRGAVAQKQQESAQYADRLKQEQEQLASYSAGHDTHEAVQIRERRQQNDELRAEVGQLMGKLSLLTVQQGNVEKRLSEKEHLAQEVKRRADQNAQTEREFAAQLQDLEQLKAEHEEKEKQLMELNQIMEDMDECFEQVDRVERMVARADGAAPTDFEGGPLLRLWLGSTAAALATMKVVSFSEQRRLTWVTDAQLQHAQTEVSRRVAEIGQVKQKLSARKQEMSQGLVQRREQLEAMRRERDDERATRDQLQSTLDGEQAVMLRQLEASMPELERQKAEAEAQEADVRRQWEQIEAQAQTKFAQAKSVLDEQQELLRQEEEQISQITEKVNALKVAEKAQLLEQLRQQAAAEGVEVQA